MPRWKRVKGSSEPVNCHIALSDPESDKWFDDTNAELQSIKDNQVLDLDLSSFEQQDCLDYMAIQGEDPHG